VAEVNTVAGREADFRYFVVNVAAVGTGTGSFQLVVLVTESGSADWLANCHSTAVDDDPEKVLQMDKSGDQLRRKVELANGHVVEARKG